MVSPALDAPAAIESVIPGFPPASPIDGVALENGFIEAIEKPLLEHPVDATVVELAIKATSRARRVLFVSFTIVSLLRTSLTACELKVRLARLDGLVPKGGSS
jgi:hypothetical protein